MLGPIDDIQHQWRRHRPASARHVILGEGPDGDRLRPNAEGIGAERGSGVERLDLAATRLQDSLALFQRRRVGRRAARRERVGKPLPFEAHAADAEVIAGRDLELERVGLEQNAPCLWHVEHHHHRRLVGPRGDHDLERSRRLEAIGIAPRERDLFLAVNDPHRRADLPAGRLHRRAIDGRCRKIAGGGGDDRHTAPLHRCDHAAANVLPPAARPLEILGEHHLRLDAGELRPVHSREAHPLPGIAGRDDKRPVGDLWRQREYVVVAVAPRSQGRLSTDAERSVVGPPLAVVAECHADLGRLAVRHHHPLWQRGNAGEGEPLDRGEGGGEASPGVGRRGGRHRGDRGAGGQRQAGGHRPTTESSWGRGCGEVHPPRLLGHLGHGGLTQGPRPRLTCGAGADDVDDAEQLVAHGGKPPLDQPRHLLERREAKSPAADRQRHRETDGDRGEQNRESHHRGRLAEPVAEEHREKRRRHAAGGEAHRLEKLDPADASPKRGQPRDEVGREGDPAVRWHVHPRHGLVLHDLSASRSCRYLQTAAGSQPLPSSYRRVAAASTRALRPV